MGRGSSGSSEPVYYMNGALRKINEKPEGAFTKMHVPKLVMVRANEKDGDNRAEIQTAEGYAFKRGDEVVFIQKDGGGWNYNMYGMTFGNAGWNKTLKEAKSPENIERAFNAVPPEMITQAKKVFNAINVKGGVSPKRFREVWTKMQKARRGR